MSSQRNKCCSLLGLLMAVSLTPPNNPDTDWFSRAGYGLFVHYLPSGSTFQREVYAVDETAFAQDCAEAMTALSGRTYDLPRPGWQQHWSLAPWRGHGFHRGWLPWVITSHLNGVIERKEFDKGLVETLIK